MTFEERKRMCFDKRPYPSRESALRDAPPHRNCSRQLYPYKCREADHWHLTKIKPRGA